MSTHELLIQRTREDTNRRWWIIAGLLGLVILLHPSQNVLEYWPVLAVLGLGIIYNFILSLLAYFKLTGRYWIYLEIFADILLINALVYFTGGVLSSPLYFLYLFFILVQAFYFNHRQVFLAGGGVIISLGLLLLLSPQQELLSWHLLERVVFVLAVTTAAGLLLKNYKEKSTKAETDLQESQLRLESLCQNNQELEVKIRTSTQQLEKANVMLVKKNLALMAFHEIYTAMSSTYNSSRLLNLVMDTAMSLLKASSGVLLLREANSDYLEAKVSRGLPGRLVRSLEFKLGHGMEGEIAQTGKAKLYADLDHVPGLKTITSDCKSKMCVPLWSQKRLVGVISVESGVPNAFSQNDLELFSTLGSQASEVLQNLEIYEELRTKADHLSLLFEVGKSIGSIFNLRTLFGTILERAMQVMKARRGFLMIYDKSTEVLRIRASLGLNVNLDQNSVQVDRGIAGWVFKKVRSVVIPNVEKSSLYDPDNDQIYVGRDLMACPLHIRKKVFGVICLNDRIGSKQFSHEDLDLLSALASQAAIAIENVELYASVRRDYLNAVKALAAAVDAKDHYTHGHSHKVMVYATTIAKAMDLSEKEIEKIKYGALLHDVGKIGISEAVLNKPSRLTPKEFDTIAMHPILGVSIVQNIESLKDLIPTILYHHERYSGGGYPEGKAGNSIPLGARVVAVADAWDVMTSDRAYRKALPISVAVSELKKCAGTQFDPEIVETFMKTLEKEEKIETFNEEEQTDVFWDEEEISRLMN
ncbi:GAF domain-containing protein [candidate division FCPU426 bacterium]|nr:GAF domain-containing protein [candidate division FCPU426 bacterium]